MSITLTAVGDISFGDSPKCFGFGVKRTVERNGADFIFEKIKGILKGDIVFGNLETVLSGNGLVPYNFYSDQMRGTEACADALKRAGFNVLNVANNHMLEHGESAFWDCISRLKENNIAVVGLRGSKGYYSEPVIMEHDEECVGFLGYAFEEDNCLGHSKDIAYAYCAEPEMVLADVRRLKEKVDFVVVSLHWGLEFAPYPSRYLIEKAYEIVNSGADVLLGHHPHVIQCVEEYKEKMIFYSLGNFVFDMVWNKDCRKSMLAKVTFQKEKAIRSQVYPVKIKRTYQPELETGNRAQHYLERLNREHKERVATCLGVNPEHENLMYYRKVAVQQLKDSLLSNLFLLLTTVCWTPWKYIPGKVGYLWRKTVIRFSAV